MAHWRADIRVVLAGGVAGVAILGVGGRMAMATLPLLTGLRPRFSWGGSLEVVLLGSIYGAFGGVVLALLRRTRFVTLPGAPLIFGLMMLGSAWASSSVGRATAATAPVAEPLVWLLAAMFFITYGFAASSLATRWSANISKTGLAA